MFPTKVALDDALILQQIEERQKEIQSCYGTGNRSQRTRALPRETAFSRVTGLWQRVRVRLTLRSSW
jgi:hypothetical protein